MPESTQCSPLVLSCTYEHIVYGIEYFTRVKSAISSLCFSAAYVAYILTFSGKKYRLTRYKAKQGSQCVYTSPADVTQTLSSIAFLILHFYSFMLSFFFSSFQVASSLLSRSCANMCILCHIIHSLFRARTHIDDTQKKAKAIV